ncbi:MAG: VCBS repeat-containing protein [Ignavibacteriae bacterium]|nr:VCBS repeat-containing protein [Ignavibacteriota bacterium]
MNKLFWFSVMGALFLVLGASTLSAQEVVFSSAPTPAPAAGASNGGFAWLDINGDGTHDLWIPPNNVLLNNLTSFTQVAYTRTAAIGNSNNSVGGLFADINGDGVPDLWSTNNAAPQTGLYFDSLGTYVPATGVGPLASAGATRFGVRRHGGGGHRPQQLPECGGTVTKMPHGAMARSAARHGHRTAEGRSSGFTRVGNGAAAGQLAIDTTRAYECWSIHFIDANNDGYQDLLMPSFRHGFRAFNGGSDTIGAKKGSILFLNDGTGKFFIPGSASLGRTLYALDSMSAAGEFYARAVADTGIIVEDTVRHFNAIGSQWGPQQRWERRRAVDRYRGQQL